MKALLFCLVLSGATALLARDCVFFVGAHPDDSEGYAATAFLLAKQYDIHVIDLTRGELGLGKKGAEDGTTAVTRIAEEKAACAVLGATPHFLCEIDGDACATMESVRKLHAAKKYGTISQYFYEVLLCQTANWHPLYSVDVSSTMAKKQEMLSKYVCQNKKNSLVEEKTRQAALRGSERNPKCAYAETFTTFDGKPIEGGVLEALAETARIGK